MNYSDSTEPQAYHDHPSFCDISARPLRCEDLSEIQSDHIRNILTQILNIYEHYEHLKGREVAETPWPDLHPATPLHASPGKDRPHQVITICGNRGTGKTSLILTLERILATRDPLREESRPRNEELAKTLEAYRQEFADSFKRLDKYRNLCLPIIFPADMESLNQATLEAIVSKLLEILDEYHNKLPRATTTDAIPGEIALEAERRRLFHSMSLSERMDRLDALRKRLIRDISTAWLFTRGDPVGLNTLASDSITFEDFARQRLDYVRKSFKRVDMWREFIDELLDLLEYDYLVIFLDDTDLTPQISKDILETIRIYLNHPRIITILAADYLQLRREIIRVYLSEHGWQQCREFGMKNENILNFVRREVDDYLYKVLPHSGRYDLTFYPDRDCREIFNRILWRRYLASKDLQTAVMKKFVKLESHKEKLLNREQFHRWLDENVFLATIGTPAARLLAFRKGSLWCWLGRSQREVTASTHRLLQEAENWLKARMDEKSEDEKAEKVSAKKEGLEDFDIDRQLLQITGARPAASRVSTLPAFSGYNFERLEMLFKLRRIQLDEEMKYVISGKETALGVDHEIVYSDSGYFYLTFLIDTVLVHAYGLDEPYPNFPLCRLLGGIDDWVKKERREHPEAEFFTRLRAEWKEQGLLRGIGNMHTIEGLEAMPACMIYLADLAHITAHGAGVSVNAHHEGDDLYKARQKEIAPLIEELERISPYAKTALCAALKRVSARDDYAELMLRRINTLICIGKKRWDQLKHIVDSLNNENLFNPKEIQEQAFIRGRPVGWTADGEHNLMILKRCRVLLAWGLAAMFDLLLERYGPDHQYICVLLFWLAMIKDEDLKDREDSTNQFIMGDIPVKAIADRIEEILKSKDIKDSYPEGFRLGEEPPLQYCKGLKREKLKISGAQWEKMATTLHREILQEPEGTKDISQKILDRLEEATGWPSRRWKTLILLARAHDHDQDKTS